MICAPRSAHGAAPAPVPGLAAEEALLDELMEIVESVDHARDLSKVGGLDTLLSLMGCPYPSLRWRAAEVSDASGRPLPSLMAFWFAWVAFHPQTQVLAAR